MKKLIIIADDFGFTNGINRGITECAARNILSGISVMVTGKYFNELPEFIKKFPDVKIGLHLDLISGNQLTGLSLKISPPKLALKLAFGGGELLKDIEKEIKMQIEKLSEIIHPEHIDSHRHAHYIPQIFKLVNQIAEECAINRIRIPVPSLSSSNLKFILNRKDFYKFLPFYFWQIFNKNNSSSTDDFFGLFQVGNLNEKYLIHILNNAKYEYAEFMTHPGYVDDELLNMDENLLYSREREIKLLIKYFSK